MSRLLIVAHAPSGNTVDMLAAVERGARHPDAGWMELRVLGPLEAEPDDVLWCQGIIIGSTENFGYMAGRIKDFFERIYYPCLENTQGLPWALYIRAGNDGYGTRISIERIVTGLKWKPIREPLICRGEFRAEFLQQCEELGMTMAAGLEAGIF